MPTLHDILAELRQLGVLPSEIKVSRRLVSEVTSKADEIAEENPESNPESEDK